MRLQATELDRAEQGTEIWYLGLAAASTPAGGTKLLDLHWVAFALSTNQSAGPVFADIDDLETTTDKPKQHSCRKRRTRWLAEDGADFDSLSTTTGRWGNGTDLHYIPFY